MAHIPVPPGAPGIIGLLLARPDTAKPLTDLAQTLLRGPSTLSPGERELIAAFVSRRNECVFCHGSHAGAARHFLERERPGVVAEAVEDPAAAPVSGKMKALLAIAGKVQKDGRLVTREDVALARERGATDQEVHDTVLIAAAFCMYNRYVDGLGTDCPPAGSPAYDEMGKALGEQGYLRPR